VTYSPSEATTPITVMAIKVAVAVSPSPPWTAGQTIAITATLTQNGNPWPGETITFIFGSAAQDNLPEIPTTEIGTAITGTDGKATLNWTIPWTIDGVQVPGREFSYVGVWHKPSDAAVWSGPGAIVFPTRISITAPDEVFTGVTFTISGVLEYESDAGVWSPLAGETVSLFYNGTKIIDIITDSAGNYSASASIPTAGTYTLRVNYPGTVTYSSSMATKSISVLEAQIETALTISAPLEVYVNETFSITGRLMRVDTGEGIPDQTIELSYNDTSIGSVTTSSDGSYSVTASIPTAGTYTLTAYYPGTATYTSSTATVSISVPTKVTGPLGFWWFPILVRLAEVFPWARNLLDKLARSTP